MSCEPRPIATRTSHSDPEAPLTTVAYSAEATGASAPLTLSASRRLRRVVSGLVAAVVLVGGWFLLAPVAIGGPTSYVVTQGVSMLPRFQPNGLVLTRAQNSYHVGEIVAYHNHQLKAVVMHRIVARDGSRYVMKGDNNDFRDSYHPTRSDLIGREWISIPHGGAFFQFLRKPIVFGVIIGVLSMISASAYAPRKSRRRRRHG